MREEQGKEPPVSQLLALSTGKSEKTRSGDLESTATLWIDLDDGYSLSFLGLECPWFFFGLGAPWLQVFRPGVPWLIFGLECLGSFWRPREPLVDFFFQAWSASGLFLAWSAWFLFWPEAPLVMEAPMGSLGSWVELSKD